MKDTTRRTLPLVLLVTVLFVPSFNYAQKERFYCLDTFSKYSEIGYWARTSISISDYSYGSEDARRLGLTESVPGKTKRKPNGDIEEHFQKEFETYLKGDISFHDTSEGFDERFAELFEKHGKEDNFLDIFNAQEEAYRNSVYGPNPGAVFCNASVERREFPVLYEIECSIVANKGVMNRGGIGKAKLGYSTPEHINGELKQAVTELIKELGETINIIRNCN